MKPYKAIKYTREYTEEYQFLKLMKKLGIKVDTFTNTNCIYEDALKKGAVVEHGIERTGFTFDKKGKFIGTNGEAINSFSGRIKK